MDPDTGNILAMASYPNFDLNNPRNAEALIGMPELTVVEKERTKNGEKIIENIFYICYNNRAVKSLHINPLAQMFAMILGRLYIGGSETWLKVNN